MNQDIIIQNLKKEYTQQRELEISDEEFLILILTYPSFLVAISDGEFDEDEKALMGEVIKNFTFEVYGNELSEEEYSNIISAYLSDFEFLHTNKEMWKAKFLNALSFLKEKENEEVKNSIINLMKEIAEVSDGTSNVEKAVIDDVVLNYL